jgi:hypothetical protein
VSALFVEPTTNRTKQPHPSNKVGKQKTTTAKSSTKQQNNKTTTIVTTYPNFHTKHKNRGTTLEQEQVNVNKRATTAKSSTTTRNNCHKRCRETPM